jgi:hypothetical protein
VANAERRQLHRRDQLAVRERGVALRLVAG